MAKESLGITALVDELTIDYLQDIANISMDRGLFTPPPDADLSDKYKLTLSIERVKRSEVPSEPENKFARACKILDDAAVALRRSLDPSADPERYHILKTDADAFLESARLARTIVATE